MAAAADVVKSNKAIQWAIVGILAIPTLVFAGWAVKKYVISGFSKTDDEKTAAELAAEVNKKRLTYTESTYKSMATTIFQAMDGPGTTWPTVKRVIGQLKNADDWKMLVGSFAEKASTTWGSSFKGNLISWLEDELDESEMEEISGMLSKINVTI